MHIYEVRNWSVHCPKTENLCEVALLKIYCQHACHLIWLGTACCCGHMQSRDYTSFSRILSWMDFSCFLRAREDHQATGAQQLRQPVLGPGHQAQQGVHQDGEEQVLDGEQSCWSSTRKATCNFLQLVDPLQVFIRMLVQNKICLFSPYFVRTLTLALLR